MIRPCFNKLSSAMWTVFEGMAKPVLRAAVVEAIAVLIPITSPLILISGPPTVPGLIARIGLQQPAKASLRLGRPLELMIPSLRSPQIKRITDRQSKISWLHHVRTASLSGLTPRLIDLKHREIHLFIAPTRRASWFDHRSVALQFDQPTALSVGHHVIVGDDMALIGHDDARPK